MLVVELPPQRLGLRDDAVDRARHDLGDCILNTPLRTTELRFIFGDRGFDFRQRAARRREVLLRVLDRRSRQTVSPFVGWIEALTLSYS